MNALNCLYSPRPWKLQPNGQWTDSNGQPVSTGHGLDGLFAERAINSFDAMQSALWQLESFVGVMFGEGEDADIPETVSTPLGIPVMLGAIMRDARNAIAIAKGETTDAPA